MPLRKRSYKVVSFWAIEKILKNFINFPFILFFKNRDVSELIKAWLIFFVWKTSFHCMKLRFFFVCVLKLRGKIKLKFPNFLFILPEVSFVVWLEIVFSELMPSAWRN